MRAAARRAENSQLLDLFVEDDSRNVYAGELEVRPPGAPTTAAQKSVVSYGIRSGIREPQETGPSQRGRKRPGRTLSRLHRPVVSRDGVNGGFELSFGHCFQGGDCVVCFEQRDFGLALTHDFRHVVVRFVA
jgi:hypothetical protein